MRRQLVIILSDNAHCSSFISFRVTVGSVALAAVNSLPSVEFVTF